MKLEFDISERSYLEELAQMEQIGLNISPIDLQELTCSVDIPELNLELIDLNLTLVELSPLCLSELEINLDLCELSIDLEDLNF